MIYRRNFVFLFMQSNLYIYHFILIPNLIWMELFFFSQSILYRPQLHLVLFCSDIWEIYQWFNWWICSQREEFQWLVVLQLRSIKVENDKDWKKLEMGANSIQRVVRETESCKWVRSRFRVLLTKGMDNWNRCYCPQSLHCSLPTRPKS